MKNHRYIISVLFFVFLNLYLTAQTDICIPNHNYLESRFQVKKLNGSLYKIVLSKLGEIYLNPCISEIQLNSNTDSLNIYCEIFDKANYQKVEINLLQMQKGFCQYFTKYKKLEFIKYIGEFEAGAVFSFTIPKNDKFILLIKNMSVNNESIAIELKKLKE